MQCSLLMFVGHSIRHSLMTKKKVKLCIAGDFFVVASYLKGVGAKGCQWEEDMQTCFSEDNKILYISELLLLVLYHILLFCILPFRVQGLPACGALHQLGGGADSGFPRRPQPGKWAAGAGPQVSPHHPWPSHEVRVQCHWWVFQDSTAAWCPL